MDKKVLLAGILILTIFISGCKIGDYEIVPTKEKEENKSGSLEDFFASLEVETPEKKETEVAEITLNVKEGDLVSLDVKAIDEDGNPLTYTFSEPLDEKGEWQTKKGDSGDYTITVGVSDGKTTTETKILLKVESVNNLPVLEKIDDITIDEGETIIIDAVATDKDDDELTFAYSGWMTSKEYKTTYDDAGEHTVTVTVSDGTDEVSQDIKITVNEVNRAPQIVEIGLK